MRLITKVIGTVREHGEIVQRVEGKNVITEYDPNTSDHNGLVQILERMFDNGAYYDPDDYINKMELGQGAPNSGGLGSPLVATLRAFDSSDLDETGGTWYNNPSHIASCTWDAGYGALSGITEAGLMSDGTDLHVFAYKTFTPALTKTAEGELTIDWTIQVSYT